MTNNRKVVSKELEDKAANLGTILKERKIVLDGVTGESILADIENIRIQAEEIRKKEQEILDSKEQLKTRRENLSVTFRNVKGYLFARSKDEPELKGLISSIKITKKRKKKDEPQPATA